MLYTLGMNYSESNKNGWAVSNTCKQKEATQNKKPQYHYAKKNLFLRELKSLFVPGLSITYNEHIVTHVQLFYRNTILIRS